MITSSVLLHWTPNITRLTFKKKKWDVFNYRAEKTGKMRECLQIPLYPPTSPTEHRPDNNYILIIH